MSVQQEVSRIQKKTSSHLKGDCSCVVLSQFGPAKLLGRGGLRLNEAAAGQLHQQLSPAPAWNDRLDDESQTSQNQAAWLGDRHAEIVESDPFTSRSGVRFDPKHQIATGGNAEAEVLEFVGK